MAKLKATPKTFEQALQVLNTKGSIKGSIKLGNNTWLESYVDATQIDRICVRLHNTNIVTFHRDGRIILNTGGYRTVTTRERINEFIVGWVEGKCENRRQESGDWFYVHGNEKRVFSDGINIGPEPLVLVPEIVKSETPDFRVQHEGSVYIFYALTDAAKQWVADHISEEEYRPWGVNGFVVEHRYAADLAVGITEDGLTVEY